MDQQAMVVSLDEITLEDIDHVGGKNASLGEMLTHLSKSGVKVPKGFATTAKAFFEFLSSNHLDTCINESLARLDVEDLQALATAGSTIRNAILAAQLPKTLINEVKKFYALLQQQTSENVSVAVRSSATAEDLPDASFAGQQDTILNVQGIGNLITAIKEVYASLYTDRAIAYRAHHGYAQDKVALSIGIQQMVRSDLAASGVMFTLDTESGFDGVVFVTSAYGLGEMVVQGSVNPDEFYLEKRALKQKQSAIIYRQLGNKQQKMVFSEPEADSPVTVIGVEKTHADAFSLTDEDLQYLGQQALIIEAHYKRPMDIEWAKDGITGEIYIVQARPETVQSRKNSLSIEKFQLKEKGNILATGRSVGQKIGQGVAKVVSGLEEIHLVKPGDVLVTDMTDPDWEPVMKRAAAIVTNRGGRTCHAAIIARELGIPAVVGCQDATQKISNNQFITVSCAEGDEGRVYDGELQVEKTTTDLSKLPDLDVKIMMNIGNPMQSFQVQHLPNAGVGLARLEFVINQMIGVHPNACLNVDKLPEATKQKVYEKSAGYEDPVDFYRSKLVEGMSTLGAAFWPNPVIVRLSDFKSNEYANLIGGDIFEPQEENPMIGFRGASRYVAQQFAKCFALECQAAKIAREEHGLTNIQIMIPFVRTVLEAEQVIEVLAQHGLKRGVNDLKIIMMCELPTNAILADEYLKHFDGFSIGSNDLTQLTLGLDRDSALVANSFSELDPAVLKLVKLAINACKRQGKYIGICGQGPSDHPELARWLMDAGIGSMSLTPDSILPTWRYLASLQSTQVT